MSCRYDVQRSERDVRRLPSITFIGRDANGVPYINFCKDVMVYKTRVFTGLLSFVNYLIPRSDELLFVSDRIYADGRSLIPADVCFHFRGDPNRAVINYFNVLMDKGEELLGELMFKKMDHEEVEVLKGNRKAFDELIQKFADVIDSIDLMVEEGVGDDERRD